MKAHLKDRIPRFLAFLIGFTIGVVVLHLVPALAPRRPPSLVVQHVESLHADRSKEVLTVLMPNGVWADDSKLELFERDELVKVLKNVQTDAHGDRALGIAFLLAALKEDYSSNRAKLLDALQGCRRLSYPAESQCADFVSSYLIELARRGDVSLLKPLFEISHLADGAFAQSLGGFYADMLEEEPKAFLLALSSYPRQAQRDFCYWAELEDGGGMDKQRSVKVKAFLNSISLRKNDPLLNPAKNCLAGVKRGTSETSSAAAEQALGAGSP